MIALLDARVPPWDRRIDLVVLTHPHEDHVAGMALLLERYRVGDIVEPGMLGPGPGDAAYRAELAAMGRQTRVVAAGDRLWLDGSEIDVDWPPPGSVPRDPPADGKSINNISIVLELHFGVRHMLFTGDAEEEVDPHLLAAGIGARLRPLDVLKVAHHGSGTATTQALIDALDPRIARDQRRLGQHLRPSVAEDDRAPRCPRNGRSIGPTSTARSRSAPMAATCAWPRTVAGHTRRHRRRRQRGVRAGSGGAIGGHGRREPTIGEMSVPSSAEAAAMVRRLAPSDRLLRHSTAVAEVAAFLASAMARRGVDVDATADRDAPRLLHDVDKMLPADDPLRAAGPRRGAAPSGCAARATPSWRRRSSITR